MLCLSLACGEEKRLVQLEIDGYRQDVFEQEAASKLDLLWVIDNSGSMKPHQDRLAAGLRRFMTLLDRGLVDYRIAVITTDARSDRGEFQGVPAIVTPQLADPLSAFQRNVQVGVGGTGHEEAFESARLAIERERAMAAEVLAARERCAEGCASGNGACASACEESHTPIFMRPNAHLHLIFVSDEDEQSVGELRFFQRFFETSLGVGSEDSVRVATLCGDLSVATCAKAPGRRYRALVESMVGITASICDESFETSLSAIALDAAGLARRFKLSNKADPSTISIETLYRCDSEPAHIGRCQERTDACDGATPSTLGIRCVPPADATNGWTFEPRANALFFNGDALPGLRARVVVSYHVDESLLLPR
jgi:hypothetical protein